MPLLCIPGAIANRPRYNDLRQKLSAAITTKSDTENGQSWNLSEEQIAITGTAEWIEMERRAAPSFPSASKLKANPAIA